MKLFKKLLIVLVIMSMIVSCDILPGFEFPTVTEPVGSSTTATSTTKREPITIVPDEDDQGPTSDPYVNVDVEEFYNNYTPATSYMDAYYRSLHNLMSGSIDAQDQAPTIAENRPEENGAYIRNTSAIFSNDGNTYYIIDSEGNLVNRIFKGGAYVTLEEVAAYVLAFADIPANYTYTKLQGSYNGEWGKYARGNHSKFSGNTKKYPYEPTLPNISGCGGSFQYYEIDIGTTGTDCDPAYPSREYNTGTYITRGAARIVYSQYDINGNGEIEIDERYVFYTYNHYNDFQEYLNYEGGWGKMFGNITGGGSLSSKYDYNPTAYPETVKRDLYNSPEQTSVDADVIELAFIYIDRKYFVNSATCA